ncbi:SEFIR domain-containing protein [Actinokineospora sp.]|uniref:SEFIR domain-containing protein n=1 Tax=Actinokineospora sp. TaxID=1872133 RepID=UPI0040383960
MSDREAPRVFITYAHESPEHKEQVRRFATFLREQIGLDVHFDRWYDNKRRDWSAWAIDHLTNADFILVIASPAYKRRADGTAAPDEGRGSQFEAAMIRDNLTKNLRRETERVLPVVLPGRSIEDIPTFLNGYSTTRFHVEEFTEKGVSELVAAITGHGQYPMPERGPWRDGAAPARPQVLLANGLPWLDRSSDVRSGSARIDGVHYGDSIVLRPTLFTAGARGFVEVDLGRAYRRMTSVVGVLDDAAEAFQVGHFRVYLDGSPQPESRAALGKPGTVEVDVTGALRLRLEMYRPGVVASPLLSGVLAAGGQSSRLPELAWGNPTLY